MNFYIVNDFDRPDERHVVQIVGKNKKHGYPEGEYIHDSLTDWCKKSGHRLCVRKSSTPLSAFGFDLTIDDGYATFTLVSGSVARYRDGRPRRWQGRSSFTLKLKPRGN